MERPVTPLPTIGEEDQDGIGNDAAEAWETTRDRNVIVPVRAAAKASHTKYIKQIESALDNPLVSSESLKEMRKNLVKLYGKIEARHARIVELAPPEEKEKEDEWMKPVDIAHRLMLDRFTRANIDSSSRSASVSRRSSSSAAARSSIVSKVREAELQVKESKLKMVQQQQEEEERAQEDAVIRSIRATQERRKLQHDHAQKTLRLSTLQEQAADLLGESMHTSSQDEDPVGDGQEKTVKPNGQSNPVASHHISSTSERRSSAPAFVPASTPGGDTQVTDASTPGFTSHSISSTPFRRLQGIASRVSNFFTPRANKLSSRYPSSSSVHSSLATSPAGSSGALLGGTQTTPSQNGPRVVVPPPSSLAQSADGPSQTSSTSVATGPATSANPLATPVTAAGHGVCGAPPTVSLSGRGVSGAPSTINVTGHGVSGALPVFTTATGHGVYGALPVSAPSGPAVCGAPLSGAPAQSRPGNSSAASLLGPATVMAPPPSSFNGPAAIGVHPSHQPTPVTSLHSPEEWIYDIGRHRASVSSGHRGVSRLPKIELPKFNGDPMAWPMFIQTFGTQVDRACSDDSERVALLRSCLSTDVEKQLGQLLLHPGLYQQCLMELHRRYGNPRIVAAACSKSLLQLESFRDYDFAALQKFSTELRSAVSTLRLGGYGTELQSNATLANVVNKLPPSLKSKWAEVSYCVQDRLPDLTDLDEWLDDYVMAEYCVRAGNNVSAPSSSQQNNNRQKQKGGEGFRPKFNGALQDGNNNESNKCAHCNRPHTTKECRKFRDVALDKRMALIKEKNLCLSCLEPGHGIKTCSSSKSCGIDGCKSKHNRLLHGAPRLFPPKESDKRATSPEAEKSKSSSTPPSIPASSSSSSSAEAGHYSGAAFSPVSKRLVLLPIVPIIISSGGRSVRTFALLDSGSEVTMVSEHVKKKLALTGPAEETRIGSWHAHDPSFRSTRVNFKVEPVDGSGSFDVTGAYTVPSLNLMKRPMDLEKVKRKWPHLANVPLSHADAGDVMLLIGYDHPDLLDVLEYRRDPVRANAPRAILTRFGWTVAGNVLQAIREEEDRTLQCNFARIDPLPDDHLYQTVEKFILMDTYEAREDVSAPVSPEILRCRQILKDTTRFIPERGRYEAGVLWKIDIVSLPNNWQGALDRFNRTMKRLDRDEDLAGTVHREMEQVIASEFARKLTPEELSSLPAGRTWILPWHPVQHPRKPGKWRIVYDAAAQFGGVSLNSVLLKGEAMLLDMLGVLIRFREHRIAICADITKMFYQVLVRKEDSYIYCFLYRPAGAEGPPDVYVMTRHIFGSICSPSVCAHVLKCAARDAAPEDVALVTKLVEHHHYVDNLAVSFPTEEEAEVGVAALSRSMSKAGFPYSQWGSSHPRVLAALPDPPVELLNLDLDKPPIQRNLGVVHELIPDCFTMRATGGMECKTRRDMLRALASNFDPFGFLGPVLVTAKILLQRACQTSCGWDVPLPSELLDEWRKWSNSLASVNDLRLPRCYCKEDHDPNAIDLVMFSDASERAFGAVGYLVFRLLDGTIKTKVAFVYAKSRLAPVKYVSIARLELCACLLSVRTANIIKKELTIKIRNVILFTDSTTCLRWFNSRACKFTVYVGNRVGEVLESYDASHWRYVPTELNPADDLSRGVPAAEFTPEHRFFTGPDFLRQPVQDWPAFPDLQAPLDGPDPEIRSLVWAGPAQQVPYRIDELLASQLPMPFSRIKRTVAFARRWLVGFRARKVRRESLQRSPSTAEPPVPDVPSALEVPRFIVKKGLPPGKQIAVDELTPSEIKAAVVLLIRRAQAAAYPVELRALAKGYQIDPASPLAKMSPFVDERGLICVGGRIERAPAPFDIRHPIVLPPKASVTRRIVKELHLITHHSSAWRTLAEMQRQYWTTSPRRVIKAVVDRCPLCRRASAKAAAPIMADLPTSRLKPFHPPFTCTGVDYFGPIEVVLFRRHVKRWVCLFTCLTTRAVHLEMAYALDTDAFLSALDNFKATRGSPAIIHADNATNFKGAQRELAEGLERLDQTRIHNHLALQGIEWRFNPPAAPHFGGSWERLVQAAKRALVSVMHHQSYTDQSLTSALKQVEHLLNSRPLTYVSTDPAAPEPLTPFHLLLGRANPNIPPDYFSPDDLTHRKRWRVSQSNADHFWRRWMAEVLPSMSSRRKWLAKERNLQIGDVVLLIDESNPRGKWPLGLIEAVHPGPDGVVRSADVRHNGTVLQRPVVKLYLLEPEQSNTADAPADRPDQIQPESLDPAVQSGAGPAM